MALSSEARLSGCFAYVQSKSNQSVDIDVEPVVLAKQYVQRIGLPTVLRFYGSTVMSNRS